MSPRRLKVALRGVVQGVGFRPFVFRLAAELGLAGWTANDPDGLLIEAEGLSAALEEFLDRLRRDAPSLSSIQSLETAWLEPAGLGPFHIRPSGTGSGKSALIMPDIATCPDCLSDISDPSNRRYRYPFTNCTRCGPRFSIILGIPYDRANTSMRGFIMCPECRAEYEDPRNRRFHAQPNACPRCGPNLELWTPAGNVVAEGHEALAGAAAALSEGRVVALKGLGGFQLLALAADSAAVGLLRRRKHREAKPFALMFPGLQLVEQHCLVTEPERRLLMAPEAPIVLLRRRHTPTQGSIAPNVAPENPHLGAMLPYTPLHHLLMAELMVPLVATSGNLSDDPICIDEREALVRLAGIADLFLVHNRPIVRPVDDSVARVVLDRPLMLRRARGYAPLPITLGSTFEGPVCALGVGAHLKGAVALRTGARVFLSQHLGDLESGPAFEAFRAAAADLLRLYDCSPALVVSDQHPDYASTRFARELAASASGPKLLQVQHHAAHVLGCMAENELAPPVLGVAWDGTGYGEDGTIWGGEFFAVSAGWKITRVARLRPFRLPGGDQAAREPRRCALGILYEAFGNDAAARLPGHLRAAFAAHELQTMVRMIETGLNSPLTSSAGRLFDAAASILGLRQRSQFEGQAAMELEFAALNSEDSGAYELYVARPSEKAGLLRLDWKPMLEGLLEDLQAGTEVSVIARRFHGALARGALKVAQHLGLTRVALSGGCFQNRCLLEITVRELASVGLHVYWHQRVPPNDGGIALGQVVAASLPSV